MTKLNNSWFVLVGILALALALPMSGVFAGSTGKISGQVLDQTGSPLPGASVVIEGTQRGAITDVDGFYVILAVDPGIYSLTGSLVGYRNVTQEDVRVAVDYTTPVDFTLKEEAIEAEEIVVTAERPPVELDKTSTKYILSSDEIQQSPIIKTTAEFISLLPGFDQSGNFSVRGSDGARGEEPVLFGTQSNRPNDVYVLIDGVRIPNQDGHEAKLFAGVNKSAIQQISVETGVTAAEYGDATGGTINIVTSDGGRDYHGWLEANYQPSGQKHWGTNYYDAPEHRDHMEWDNPTWLGETDPLTGRVIHVREDYTSYSGYTTEGSVSGPLGSKASFLGSVKHDHTATDAPSASSHGFLDDRGRFMMSPNNVQGSGTLTFKPSPNVKVKLGVVLQRYVAWNNEQETRGYADEGFIRGTRKNLRNLFLPDNWAASGKYKHREELEYLTFTHTISPKTFYEVRVARSVTDRDTLGFDYAFAPNGYYGVPRATTNSRKDAGGWFIVDREVAMWMDSERERYSIKADLSSQITKGNFVKTGFELVRYNAWYTFWTARSKSDNWFGMYAGGDTPWQMGDGNGATPIRGSVYVQDKMEFEGLIVNAGVRLDFQKHGHEELRNSGMMWAPMWRRFNNRHYAYGLGAASAGLTVGQDFALTPPTQVYLSPRLGISHPVSDQMVMHFSLGRFVQWMDLFDQYSKSYRNFGRLGPDGDPNWLDVNGDGVRQPAEFLANMDPHYSGFGGDPWTNPEEVMTFEVGFDWNFVSDYSTSLTAFYRNETQQIRNDGTAWGGPKKGSHYTRGKANSAADYAKGLELALGKRMSNYFSFRVAWTTMWTASGNMGLTQYGQHVRPDSNFVTSGQFWYDFAPQSDGSLVALPLTDKEKVDFGKTASGQIRSWYTLYDQPTGIGTPRFWGVMEEYGGVPFAPEGALYNRYSSLGGNRYGPMGAWAGEKNGNRLGNANAQIVLNTPADVNFGTRWMSWMVSDLNVNVLWKLVSGGRIRWTPPGAERRRARGPINAVTDLSAEKVFNSKGRVRPSFFVEVRNLFNDKQDTDGGTNYQRWGLQMARPDNKDFLNYGDFRDRSFYRAPRQTNLGFRIIF